MRSYRPRTKEEVLFGLNGSLKQMNADLSQVNAAIRKSDANMEKLVNLRSQLLEKILYLQTEIEKFG